MNVRRAAMALVFVAYSFTRPDLGISRTYPTPENFNAVEADLVVNDALFWSQEKVGSVTSDYKRIVEIQLVTKQDLALTEVYTALVDQGMSHASVQIEPESVVKPEIIPTKTPIRAPQIASVTYDARVIASTDVSKDAFDTAVIAHAPGEIVTLIKKYADEYGVDASRMTVIAQCESGMRADAVSPSGAYVGLFQFVSSTWVSNRNAMGLDSSPALRANAEEAIRTAAFKMSRDGYGAWPECGRA